MGFKTCSKHYKCINIVLHDVSKTICLTVITQCLILGLLTEIQQICLLKNIVLKNAKLQTHKFK